jgi:hypothetical protein
MKHATAASVVAIALLGVAACKLVAAPVQCASDDDCARFDATCDIGQGVCAAPDGDSTEGTFTAPLDASTPAHPAASAPTTSATTDPTPPDASAPTDAGTQDATTQTLVAAIHCGAAKCTPGKEVCCIGAAGPTCTAAADCAAAPVACDDTSDCVAAGSTGICCGYNDGANPPALLKAQCVPADQCDATGPQDQLCSLKGPASQCDTSTTGPGSTCKSFTYSNATYAFCVGP